MGNAHPTEDSGKRKYIVLINLKLYNKFYANIALNRDKIETKINQGNNHIKNSLILDFSLLVKGFTS